MRSLFPRPAHGAFALALVCALAPPAPLAAQLTGRVVAVDGGDHGALVVRARAGAEVRTATVGEDGRFTLEVPTDRSSPDVDLLVAPADLAAGDYHPAALWVAADALQSEQTVLLVPRRWTVGAGRYAGTTVEISAERAFRPACVGCTGFFRRGSTLGEGVATGGVPGWPVGQFPLRLALDRTRSEQALTAADSTRFWVIVDEAQQIVGKELFRPVPFRLTRPVDDDGPNDVVLVWAVPSMRAPGRGTAGFHRDRILTAAVWIRDTGWLARDEGRTLVMHELLHTLGFGHTCAWRSVMADNNICPRMRSPVPTAEDVAYMELALALNVAAWETGAKWGMEAAYTGERLTRELAASR